MLQIISEERLMKVLVCGSRHFETEANYQQLKKVLGSELGFGISEIIHGGARGADTHAGRYAEEAGIPVREFPADWKQYGKRAGPIRNSQMLREGMPDYCVAFLAPNSRGTKNMIEQARRAGIPTKVINIETETRQEVS